MIYLRIEDNYIKLEFPGRFMYVNELEECASYISGYISHYAKHGYMPVGSKEQHQIFNFNTI